MLAEGLTLGSVAEWVGAAAEILVAMIILWELEENRRLTFLSKASSTSMYKMREKIYAQFVDSAGDTPSQKSQSFAELFWATPKLKDACDRQILFFNMLGYMSRHAVFDKILGLNQYTSHFPHTVIRFWIMLQRYIRDREVGTGPWWAIDFRTLTLECLDYFLAKGNGPELRIQGGLGTGSKVLIISESDLRQLRSELRERHMT